MYQLKAMLTFDLHDANSKQYAAFNNELARRTWQKSKTSETTWTVNFKAGISPEAATQDAMEDVKGALMAARAADTNRIAGVSGDLELSTLGEHKFRIE